MRSADQSPVLLHELRSVIMQAALASVPLMTNNTGILNCRPLERKTVNLTDFVQNKLFNMFASEAEMMRYQQDDDYAQLSPNCAVQCLTPMNVGIILDAPSADMRSWSYGAAVVLLCCAVSRLLTRFASPYSSHFNFAQNSGSMQAKWRIRTYMSTH